MRAYASLLKDYGVLEQSYQDNRYNRKAVRDDLREKLKLAEDELEHLSVPFWIDLIVQPLANRISRRYPEYVCEVLGPFGIGCRVSIHLYPKEPYEREKNARSKEAYDEMMAGCKSITFAPSLSGKPRLRKVDYSVNINSYAIGTIGEMNGFNYPEEDIPVDATIQWFVDQIEDEG